MGWSGIKNGELLDKMRQERFDVLITGDRNLQFQQHLPAAGVAVVVLRAGSTRLSETLPLMKEVLEQIESLRPGAVDAEKKENWPETLNHLQIGFLHRCRSI